jgi:hypothetical protein
MQVKYRVTRKFIGGMLSGITQTETWTFKPRMGAVLKPYGGTSPYEVIGIEEIEDRRDMENELPCDAGESDLLDRAFEHCERRALSNIH